MADNEKISLAWEGERPRANACKCVYACVRECACVCARCLGHAHLCMAALQREPLLSFCSSTYCC